jgi:Glycosyltransferase
MKRDGGAMTSAIAVLEWNQGGHHDTHLGLYVEALLRLGCSVAVLCANPEGLEASMRAEPGRLAIGRIPRVTFRSKRKRWSNWWRARRHGREVRTALNALETRLGRRCGEVFLTCIYDSQVQNALAVVKGLGLPWSGMYLQAHWFHDPTRPPLGAHRDFPIPRLLATPGLRGLLMLDESMADRVRAHTGRPVVVAPDFTDVTAGAGHPLGRRYRAFAGRRPLVGSLGHLQPSKGCVTLAEISLRADAEDLAFLFAGNVIWQVFDPGQRACFLRAMTEAPHAIFHCERVPDERAYNSLVEACDVLFAAYVDFPHSSNTLTKAAVFEKPIIVSDGHLMAARVREYRLGEVVPAGDAEAALRAIRTITTNPAAWRERMRPRWEEYRELHSVARLDPALRELLSA